MIFLDSFVAAVGQTDRAWQEWQARGLEHGEVVRFALCKGGAKQPLIAFAHQHLRFEGVALLFAAVGPFLFFWGARLALRWHQ